MKIEGFVWYADVLEKLESKHHVTGGEVENIFERKPLFRMIEKGHIRNENLYRALGQCQTGRYLAVFFIYKATKKALVVSARDMSVRERRIYAKRKK
jgi:uncharacterized DUF497 family protein